MPYVPKSNKSSLRRTACDRCRMQKLKCLRDDGGQPRCNRCAKLNVACEVGRAGRPGRPRKADPNPGSVASTSTSTSTSSANLDPNSSFVSREVPDGETIQHPGLATDQLQDLFFGADANNVGLDLDTRMEDDNNIFVSAGDFGTIGGGGGAGDYDLDLDLDLPPPPQEPPLPPPPPLGPSQGDDDDEKPRIDPALLNNHQEITPKHCFLQGLQGGFASAIPPPTANQHECLKELSQLNVELHAQSSLLKEADPESLSMGTFIVATPPPIGDGLNICERSLNYAQSLYRTMGALRWVLNNNQHQQQSRVVREKPAPPPPLYTHTYEEDILEPEALPQNHHRNLPSRDEFCAAGGSGCGSSSNVNSGLDDLAPPPPPPPPTTGITTEDEEVEVEDADADDDNNDNNNNNNNNNNAGTPSLDAPVALLLVSCYAQLVGLFETIFHHVHRRLASLDTKPMPGYDPAKGVQLGVFYSLDGRIAGMVYAQIVGALLDRIDLGLGLGVDALPVAGAGAGKGRYDQGLDGLLSRPQHFELLQRELRVGDDEREKRGRGAGFAADEHVNASGDGGGSGSGSESKSARPRELRDAVERARLIMATDASW